MSLVEQLRAQTEELRRAEREEGYRAGFGDGLAAMVLVVFLTLCIAVLTGG